MPNIVNACSIISPWWKNFVGVGKRLKYKRTGATAHEINPNEDKAALKACGNSLDKNNTISTNSLCLVSQGSNLLL